ncbi:TetR family transcriptional regulator [Bradyrhizobium sp. CSA207]|uniref:TetR/AcrR family transcriptional regulator n=1 Tax=Bradyrhizobium sp. CSA207 TaxID=2698826 RepID=UPI0023AF9522|nr:TetR/AcrR family transcriptional regulator [Bradyrhizobium sp. CSA207]MDE5445789.1 TetR family transcriptional regulator [Bradyrhizobium sp. CSA207]
MKVSKAKLAENRAAMIHAAGHLFQERGVDGVGIAEICKEAGLTHGALYAQFGSKNGLLAEALAASLQASRTRMLERGKKHTDPLMAYVDYYLSERHRDDIAGGCSFPALGADVARQDALAGDRFADGFLANVEAIACWLPHVPSEERISRASAILSLMSGAVTASRAVSKVRPELATQILSSARDAVESLTGKAAFADRRLGSERQMKKSASATR